MDAGRKSIPNALYIPSVPSSCTDEQLKARFSTYGRITSCIVLPHKLQYKTGNYAFVEFKNVEAAEQAKAAKITIDSVQLTVRTKTVAAAAKQPTGSKKETPGVGGQGPTCAVSRAASFPPQPFPSLDAPRNQVSEHAEKLAVRYMVWLGFHDAKCVGRHINDPDGGLDISSTHAVAQVKAQWHGFKQPRPAIQAFVGACSAREHVLKGNRLFFAPLYSAEAVAYADEQNMKLFSFNSAGQVSPENMAAKTLLTSIGKK